MSKLAALVLLLVCVLAASAPVPPTFAAADYTTFTETINVRFFFFFSSH